MMGDACLEELGWWKGVFDLPGGAEQTVKGTFRKQSKTSKSAVAHDDPEKNEADDDDEESNSCDGKGEKRDGEVRTLELVTTSTLSLCKTPVALKEFLWQEALLRFDHVKRRREEMY